MTESEQAEPAELQEPIDGGRKRRIFRASMAPTMLTLGNLVCGFLAIAYMTDAHAAFDADAAGTVTEGATGVLASHRVVQAGWVILLGMVFDALDGRVARMTRSTSEFGEVLDCLADLVTFGVAPALVAKVVIQDAFITPGGHGFGRIAFLTAAFYAVCAALRLARYSAEHEDEDAPVGNFRGLPSPGAAGVIAALALCHEQIIAWGDLAVLGKTVGAYAVGFGIVASLALLMVSRVPFVHVGNHFFGKRHAVGKVALALFVVMALMASFDPTLVLAAGFCLYALSGPLLVIPRLIRKRSVQAAADLFE